MTVICPSYLQTAKIIRTTRVLCQFKIIVTIATAIKETELTKKIALVVDNALLVTHHDLVPNPLLKNIAQTVRRVLVSCEVSVVNGAPIVCTRRTLYDTTIQLRRKANSKMTTHQTATKPCISSFSFKETMFQSTQDFIASSRHKSSLTV